jgi:ribose transport system substrate-binding protein
MRDHVTIAMIAPDQPEDFFDLLWQGVWEATFDLSPFGVEVENFATENGDVCEQRQILESLLDRRPDAIGLLPLHSCALDDLIEQHSLAGTPVVTFHGDAPASQRAAFVRPDLQLAGALAGELLAKLIGGQGRILSLPGSLDEFHLAQRYKGFRAAMARFADRMEEVPGPLSGSSSFLTPEWLRSYGPVEGYYIGNEDLVPFATMVEPLRQRIPCVGFSNTDLVRPFLERGVVSAVIDESRYQLGYFAVQKAYEAVLKSADRSPLTNVQIPSTVIFGANASAKEDSLDNAFEMLVRQRTEVLISYKKRLEEANAKLLDLAVTDPLTGASSKRH